MAEIGAPVREAQPDVAALEERIVRLEDQLKKLQDVVREHFAMPDHHVNREPLRELQENSVTPSREIEFGRLS